MSSSKCSLEQLGVGRSEDKTISKMQSSRMQKQGHRWEGGGEKQGKGLWPLSWEPRASLPRKALIKYAVQEVPS